MPEITLTVGGKIYSTFTRAEVTRSMETLCGSFSFELVQSISEGVFPQAIQPGAACKVAVEGKTLISGFVDDVSPRYDAHSHTIVIAGRDRTGDLVDCSAIFGNGNWLHANLLQIARDLCGPFGIGVSSDVDLSKTMVDVQIQPGETVFEMLERLSRMYAVVMVSDGRGNVLFTRAGTAGQNTRLKLGDTIERAEGQFSARQRYSKYIVLGQLMAGPMIDPLTATFGRAEADDPGMGRYRPLVIIESLGDDDQSYFEKRALWEAAVRAGRARRAVYTVPGWRDASDHLWEINRLVPIDDDFMGIHDTMLIIGTRFSIGMEGTHTELTVTRRSAFDLAPIKPSDGMQFDRPPVADPSTP